MKSGPRVTVRTAREPRPQRTTLRGSRHDGRTRQVTRTALTPQQVPAPDGQATTPDVNNHAPAVPFPEDQVAEVLLEHARWIGSDLAQRIDTMTQRAGILLGASLTLASLWSAIILAATTGQPLAVAIGCAASLLAYGIPTAYSLSALTIRTYHSIGADSITRHLTDDGRPNANDWPEIHNRLLHDLVHTSDKGSPSVLHGMENDINRKTKNLKAAQISLVVATVFAPATAIFTYAIRSIS